MDCLLINAIVYIVTYIYLLYKHNGVTIANTVFCAFTILAILGYVTTKMGIQLVGDVRFGEKASAIPYLCLYVTVLLIISPFRVIRKRSEDFGVLKTKKMSNFIIFSFFVFFIVTLLKLYELRLILNMGFAEAYAARHFDGGNLITMPNPILEFLCRKGMSYVSVVFPIAVYYSIYRLKQSRSYMGYILNVFFLFLSFVPNILDCLTIGSKGMLFFLGFDFVFYYLFFRASIPSKAKYCIKLIGISFGVVFVTYAFVIQTERNDYDKSDKLASEVMLRYLGEAMPNLGALYNDTKVHPYGERFFPYLMGGKIFDNGDENAYYWTMITKARILNFKTIWGDSYIEFGFLGSFLFIIIIVSVYKRFVFRYYPDVCVFPLIYYYFNKVCIYGLFDVRFVDARALQLTFYYIIFALLLKYYLLNTNGNKKNYRFTSTSVLSFSRK